MPGKLSFRARLQEQLDVATAAMAAAGTALTIQRQWNCIDLAHTVQFRCKCDNKWSSHRSCFEVLLTQSGKDGAVSVKHCRLFKQRCHGCSTFCSPIAHPYLLRRMMAQALAKACRIKTPPTARRNRNQPAHPRDDCEACAMHKH